MSSVVPVASVSAVATATARSHGDHSGADAKPVVKHVQPIRYYGGLDGMNATNLIFALQLNGTVSGGYSAKAIETGGTPPPTIVDRGA